MTRSQSSKPSAAEMSTSCSECGKTSTAGRPGAKFLPPAVTKPGAAAQFLAEVREVAALEALRANAKAVEPLTARRWFLINPHARPARPRPRSTKRRGSRNKPPTTSTAARSKSRKNTCRTYTTPQPPVQSWKKQRKNSGGERGTRRHCVTGRSLSPKSAHFRALARSAFHDDIDATERVISGSIP